MFFAIPKAGGTIVNYSPLDAPNVVRHKIADSETDIIGALDLATPYPLMDEMLKTTRLRCLVVGNLAEMTGGVESGGVAAAERVGAIAWDDARLRFQDLVAGDAVPVEATAIDVESAIAVLQYTGGSEGLRPGAEVFLCVLPLSHIYALTWQRQRQTQRSLRGTSRATATVAARAIAPAP
jgi:long-chain acyl-CoA synthetase